MASLRNFVFQIKTLKIASIAKEKEEKQKEAAAEAKRLRLQKESHKQLLAGPKGHYRLFNAFYPTDIMSLSDFKEIQKILATVISQLKTTKKFQHEEESPPIIVDEDIKMMSEAIDELLQRAAKHLLQNGNYKVSLGTQYKWFDIEHSFNPDAICASMTSFLELVWGAATEHLVKTLGKNQYIAAVDFYNGKYIKGIPEMKQRGLEEKIKDILEKQGNFVIVKKGKPATYKELETFIMKSLIAEFTELVKTSRHREEEIRIFNAMENGEGPFISRKTVQARLLHALTLCCDLEDGILLPILRKYRNMMEYYHQVFPELNPTMVRPPLLRVDTPDERKGPISPAVSSPLSEASSPILDSLSQVSSPSQTSPMTTPSSTDSDSSRIGSPMSDVLPSAPGGPGSPMSAIFPTALGARSQSTPPGRESPKLLRFASHGKGLFKVALQALKEPEEEGVLYRPPV